MATTEIVDSNTGEVYDEPMHARKARMNTQGQEVVSCVSKVTPRKSRTMRDTMEEMMRGLYLQHMSRGEEYESFEEANDFDVDDDDGDFVSEYEFEEEFDPLADEGHETQDVKESPEPGVDESPTDQAPDTPPQTA